MTLTICMKCVQPYYTHDENGECDPDLLAEQEQYARDVEEWQETGSYSKEKRFPYGA